MINFMMIQGILTEDPNIQTLASGNRVTNVAVVCYRDEQARSRRRVDFVRLSFWNKLADELQGYKKGDTITVTGRLESTPRRTENKKYSLYSVRVSRIADPDTFDKVQAVMRDAHPFA